MFNELLQLAHQLGEKLKAQQLKIVTAESCTGGQVAYILTSIAGSSRWFERGFVTYSDQAKQEMLGVPLEIITSYGAVSKETALAMAKGALEHSCAEISIAVTGIAGPSGGTSKKPVGSVWLAWGDKIQGIHAKFFQFDGDRLSIRDQTTQAALQQLIDF